MIKTNDSPLFFLALASLPEAARIKRLASFILDKGSRVSFKSVTDNRKAIKELVRNAFPAKGRISDRIDVVLEEVERQREIRRARQESRSYEDLRADSHTGYRLDKLVSSIFNIKCPVSGRLRKINGHLIIPVRSDNFGSLILIKRRDGQKRAFFSSSPSPLLADVFMGIIPPSCFKGDFLNGASISVDIESESTVVVYADGREERIRWENRSYLLQ